MSGIDKPSTTSMFRILLIGFFHLLLNTDVEGKPTFDNPPTGGATVEIDEDKALGSDIYTLQVTDTSGNVLVFKILTQSPSKPVFTIDDTTDSLVVPSQGLDAENATQFNFTFSVTAGSNTETSDLLTVQINDVNEDAPAFQNMPYTGEVWKNDPAGTTIATVSAIDPDISNLTITYGIAGAQTTFSMDTSGVINLADPAGLTSLSSPTELQVQASDGGRTGTAAVSITIHADPCIPSPCENGGTCISTRGNYTCTCLSGYEGAQCQTVDHCYQSPCQNNGTCINNIKGYTCLCLLSNTGQNCSTAVTTTSTITPPTTPTTNAPTTSTNRPPTTPSQTTTSTTGTTNIPSPVVVCACNTTRDEVDVHLIIGCIFTALCVGITIAHYIITVRNLYTCCLHANTSDPIEANQNESNKTDEEKCTHSPPKRFKNTADQTEANQNESSKSDEEKSTYNLRKRRENKVDQTEFEKDKSNTIDEEKGTRSPSKVRKKKKRRSKRRRSEETEVTKF